MIVFGKNRLYSGKLVFYMQKLVVFEQSGSIRAELLYFGQKLLSSGKMVVFRKIGCTGEERLYSGKVVVFGQNLSFLGIFVVFWKTCL